MIIWNVFLDRGKFLVSKLFDRHLLTSLSKRNILKSTTLSFVVKNCSHKGPLWNSSKLVVSFFVSFLVLACNNNGNYLGGLNAENGSQYFWKKFENYQLPPQIDSFPYVKESNHNEIIEKPNIFFLFLRACNASFVEAENGRGAAFTPNINQVKRLGLSVENFYGSSTNALLGQFTVLSGINPGFKNPHKALELRVNPLSRILEKNNFSTFLFDGSLEPDKYGEINAKNFQHVENVGKVSLSEEEKLNCWGKGLRDDFLYKRVFNKLDQWHKKHGDEQKFFGVISPVSHYQRFKDVPDSLRFLYPQPKDELEMFSNSIYLEDLYIKTFFAELGKREYLRNSLVVVTGINSYPAGEHGYSNKNGWYEDRFKVPLMLIWPGNILPGKVNDIAYSQIDIAPTILDLVGVSAKNHFVGRSILDTLRRDQKPIYLTQPNDGKYLAVVKFPFKYVKNEDSGKELLFNLIEDPLEEKNLIANNQYKEALSSLRRDFSFFYFNQTILDQNRVWLPTEMDEDV